MPSRDADAKVLEQFLRTMAPPAALTATYRQRVVRASLDARSRMDIRRRLQRLVAGAVIIGCAAFLPVCFLAASLQSLDLGFQVDAMPSAQYFVPGTALPNAVSGRHVTADSYELSIIRSQFQSRFELWTAAQQAESR